MTRIVTATTTEIRDGETFLKRITVNTAVASAVVTVHDNTADGVTAADPNGIVESVTPAAGPNEALTLDGAFVTTGVANLGYGRTITWATAADEVGKTITVTGTDENGVAASEVITATAGPTTDTGTQRFLTVTGIVMSADTAGAITIGATVAAGSIQAIITEPATLLQNHYTLEYGIPMRHGLTIVTSSTADITVANE